MPKKKIIDEKLLIELYQSNIPIYEIVEKLNVSVITIRRRMKKLGYKTRTRKESTSISFKKYWKNKVHPLKGRKQSEEQKRKNSERNKGEKNPKYRHGGYINIVKYRKLIKKEKCDLCGSLENLGIHHKDLNGYNDDIKNLQVICNSCHISLHKTLYWKCKREGVEYKCINKRIGWKYEKIS